jgi:hypothetical protein
MKRQELQQLIVDVNYNKKSFINFLLKKRYKADTAKRYYYFVHNYKQPQTVIEPVFEEFSREEVQKPHILKLLTYKDLIRYYKEVDRKLLLKHGFTNLEINWLILNSYPVSK